MDTLKKIQKMGILKNARSYMLTNREKRELINYSIENDDESIIELLHLNNLPYEKLYYTNYNYGKPFKVYIKDNLVKIFPEIITKNLEEIVYDKNYYKYTPMKIFIGKSMDKNNEYYGKEYDGNTILLQLDKYNYVYIGDIMYKFKTDFEIIHYESPVGNNEFPYPYAKDTEGNYYLMIENVIIDHKNKVKSKNLYDYYYDHFLITQDVGTSKKPKSEFQGITKFYIGSEQYTLTYNPETEKSYNFISEDSKIKLYIIKNGQKKVLTKTGYIKLMKDFGEKMGFRQINKILILF